MATLSLILLFADIAYKRSSHSKPHHHLDCNFVDTFVMFSSLLTLISASIHYNYLSNGKQQPICFSMISLAFSVCVFCSCVFQISADKLVFTMRCRHLGPMNLEIEMGGKLYDKLGPTQFGGSICQMGQMHPQGVQALPISSTRNLNSSVPIESEISYSGFACSMNEVVQILQSKTTTLEFVFSILKLGLKLLQVVLDLRWIKPIVKSFIHLGFRIRPVGPILFDRTLELQVISPEYHRIKFLSSYQKTNLY